MQGDRQDPRQSNLAAPKRLHGTNRAKANLIMEQGLSGRPITAGASPSSRYWRAGAAVGQPVELWVGRPSSNGSWTGDKNSTEDGATTYESRMQSLAASSNRTVRRGSYHQEVSTVKRGNPAVAMRQRPNSSSVYSTHTAGKNDSSGQGHDVQRAMLSQSMPVFQQPGKLEAANQLEDESGNRRSGPGGIVRRGSVELIKPTALDHRSLSHSASYTNGDTQRRPFSSGGRSTAPTVAASEDCSIEIFEPVRKTTISPTAAFSVSPITIQHAEINDTTDNAAQYRGAGHTDTWSSLKPDVDIAPVAQGNPSGGHSSLPDLFNGSTSSLWQRPQTSSPLLGAYSSSSTKYFNGAAELLSSTVQLESAKAAEQTPKITTKLEEGNAMPSNGLFALRGSLFTTSFDAKSDPVGDVQPMKKSLSHKLDEISNSSALAIEAASPAVDVDSTIPPAPFMRCMTSPLAEKKQFSIISKQSRTFKNNSEWKTATKVKPILKKSGLSYSRKEVKFDLSENTYSDHVPYESPLKPSENISEGHSRELAAAMRPQLLASSSNSLTYSSSKSSNSSSFNTISNSIGTSVSAESIVNNGLSLKQRNSILLKYNGGQNAKC